MIFIVRMTGFFKWILLTTLKVLLGGQPLESLRPCPPALVSTLGRVNFPFLVELGDFIYFLNFFAKIRVG
jgi:hypothetical protein